MFARHTGLARPRGPPRASGPAHFSTPLGDFLVPGLALAPAVICDNAF